MVSVPPRVAVYTAITGGYNDLQPVPTIPGVDCIAYVEGAAPHHRDGWEVRPAWASARHPRRAAKLYKLFPHLVLPTHDATIWIDGTVALHVPEFVDLALRVAEPSGLALWRHPERGCIYQEAVVSVTMDKYADEPIMAQAGHYQDQGHPVDAGLWACGILARWHRPEVETLCGMWADEVDRWSVQDQLSFPVVARRLGFTPDALPAALYDNPWLTVTGHNPTF